MEKEYVVIDTNVPLLNDDWYKAFKDKVIVIPFTMITEIDGLKKSMDIKGIHARNMSKLINKISEESKDKEDGIAALEEGNFMIHLPRFSKANGLCAEVLDFNINDDKIIYSAIRTKEKFPESKVTLISNDNNVRSKLLGMYKTYKVDAKPYNEDASFKIRDFYTQYEYDITDENLSKLYSEKLTVSDIDNNLFPNNPITFISGDKKILARVKPNGKDIKPVDKKETYKIGNFKPLNENQMHLISMALDEDIKILGIIGRTGSGKSVTSTAVALHLLDTGKVSKIKLIKPYQPLGNTIGMLKGGWSEKISPIRKTYISVFHMLGRNLDDMEEAGLVEFTTPEFERGENYYSTALIISEAQNMNKEIKGFNSPDLSQFLKVVVVTPISFANLPIEYNIFIPPFVLYLHI